MTATATASRKPKPKKLARPDSGKGLFSDWENEMAKQWTPLVFHVIRRYFRPLLSGPHHDDVVSEGHIGLAMAIRHHDPHRVNPNTGRPTQFNTYAVHVIYNQIRRWTGRHFERESRLTFVQIPDAMDERNGRVGGQYTDERYAEMMVEMEDAEEARVEASKRLRQVSRRDIRILKCHLGGFTTDRKRVRAIPKRTVKQLAEMYQTSPREIQKRIARAKGRLGIEKIECEAGADGVVV